jgi:hypothetical protein
MLSGGQGLYWGSKGSWESWEGRMCGRDKSRDQIYRVTYDRVVSLIRVGKMRGACCR